MQYAVITGATQGIGKAIAEKLLQQGLSVAVCARNEKDLQMVKDTWSKAYPHLQVLAIKADLSIKTEVVSFATQVLATFPRIDMLVNNAGVYMGGKLADEEEGQLEKLMNTNLYSAYHLTRRLLPAIKQQAQGHIFNICSVASLKAYPNGGAYSITKYALMGFSENLREELKPNNIKVTAICPGATHSRSWDGSGVAPERIMQATDVADMLWAAYTLSAQADVETIVMRPVKGDI